MKKSGFTLVELMIVMAIIGILSAVLFPSMSRYLDNGRRSSALVELKRISAALLQLYIDTGKIAGGCQINTVDNPEYDLSLPNAGLVDRPTDFSPHNGCQWLSSDNWNGPYLQKIPKDPWGTSYWYDPDYWVCDMSTGIDTVYPALVSFGPNKTWDYPTCARGGKTDDVYYIIDKL